MLRLHRRGHGFKSRRVQTNLFFFVDTKKKTLTKRKSVKKKSVNICGPKRKNGEKEKWKIKFEKINCPGKNYFFWRGIRSFLRMFAGSVSVVAQPVQPCVECGTNDRKRCDAYNNCSQRLIASGLEQVLPCAERFPAAIQAAL